MAYCKREQLKNYLGVSEGTDDVLIEELIVRSQKAIDNYCGRTFEASGETTKYYDVPADGDEVYIDGVTRTSRGARTLYLDDDLLTISTSGLTNGDGTVISSTYYDLLPINRTPKYAIRLKQSSPYSWCGSSAGVTENIISVKGTWGFATTAPADIAHATIRLAAYYYRQKDAQVFDVTALPEEGVMMIPVGLPKDVMKIIEPYRRRV